MRNLLTIAISLVAPVAMWTSTAEAALISGTSGADTIIVGMIKRAGDTAPLAYGCVDDGTTGTWTLLGNSSGLTASGEVQGMGGGDYMSVVDNKCISGPTHCQVAGQTWCELLYNGYYLDLGGGDGNDSLQDGGASHDTWLYGDANNDSIYQSSTLGAGWGGANNDRLFSYVTGAYDYLNGEADTDCLYSSDGSVYSFSCGTGDDTTSLSGGALPADCEHGGASSC